MTKVNKLVKHTYTPEIKYCSILYQNENQGQIQLKKMFNL